MADSQSQSIESLLQQGICLHLAGLCPHSLFRFHPEFDEIIAAILQGDPAGIVVLREGHYPPLTKRLKERFFQCDAIPPPRLGYADYLCVMLLADVMLDPLHFGGGKTSLDALSLGVPIVTLPGKFMRGRATFGCYRKMQVMDWVASSKADYVEKAVAIATDDVLRNKLSREIVTARRLLQEDEEMVRELEHFFLKAVKELFLDDLALKNNSALLVFHVYFATD